MVRRIGRISHLCGVGSAGVEAPLLPDGEGDETTFRVGVVVGCGCGVAWIAADCVDAGVGEADAGCGGMGEVLVGAGERGNSHPRKAMMHARILATAAVTVARKFGT